MQLEVNERIQATELMTSVSIEWYQLV